jgi:hypothetical protein
MRFLIPQGIGDAIWALMKIEDANRKMDPDGRLEVYIAAFNTWCNIEGRALDFVGRFKFVDSARMYGVPARGQSGAVLLDGPIADENGYYRYIPDGETKLPNIDYVLMPNAALERGIRLEHWLPEFEINWNVMDQFHFREDEVAEASETQGEFVAFFLASMDSNGIAGHNRNGLWRPEDWADLGERIMDRFGVQIVVVGADYDRSYYEQKVKPLTKRPWIDQIGSRSIGTTFSLLRRARFMISYQSGIGIVTNYLGVPLGIFWRGKGDSISPQTYISFEESMASAWANPAMIETGKHLPLIYGRHGVDYIMDQIIERNW